MSVTALELIFYSFPKFCFFYKSLTAKLILGENVFTQQIIYSQTLIKFQNFK